MAEVYPSDQELLNLVSDVETGVEYIETGKAPYYLEFRKLMHRLLVATRRVNDLRVYDEGGLTIGIKPGYFWDGRYLRSYVGSTGQVLADNKDHIYVYLNAAGAIILDEYSDWPDVSENHIRLAVITTSNGDITDFEDVRGQHLFHSFAPALADAAIKAEMLGSETNNGIRTGPLACKTIGTTELKALLDAGTHEVIPVKADDMILQVDLWVQTATATACVVTIGVDAAVEGSAADPDGLILNVNTNTTGLYSSAHPSSTYTGDKMAGGALGAANDGYITISSGSDQTSSTFQGRLTVWYVPK